MPLTSPGNFKFTEDAPDVASTNVSNGKALELLKYQGTTIKTTGVVAIPDLNY
jgi:hypothetical protein